MSVRIEVDLRFVEVGYELMMLSQYVGLLEASLPAIIEAEKKRIWSELDPGEDADRNTGNHLEDRLKEGVSTRFLVSAAIMATWAIYEATVERMADYVREAKEKAPQRKSLQGLIFNQSGRRDLSGKPRAQRAASPNTPSRQSPREFRGGLVGTAGFEPATP